MWPQGGSSTASTTSDGHQFHDHPHAAVEREPSAPVAQSRAVAEAIRQGMLDGDYVPGQRLIEEDIARRYSSSRFLVRRAFDELATECLIDRLPNRGSRLRHLSVSTAIELYAARGALDALVAANAALRTTSRDARSLATRRAEIIRASTHDDVGQFGRVRSACTSLLVEISGQTEAGRLAEQTTSRLWWYRRHLALGRRPPRVAVKDTIALIDAVRARDAHAAQHAVSSHTSAVCAALRNHAAAGSVTVYDR
jgi:DNA-binding GntR family transcriptional regulator